MLKLVMVWPPTDALSGLSEWTDAQPFKPMVEPSSRMSRPIPEKPVKACA